MIDNTTYSGNMKMACKRPNLDTQNPSNAYMVRKYKLVIGFLNSNSHHSGFFSLLNVKKTFITVAFVIVRFLASSQAFAADIFKVT